MDDSKTKSEGTEKVTTTTQTTTEVETADPNSAETRPEEETPGQPSDEAVLQAASEKEPSQDAEPGTYAAAVDPEETSEYEMIDHLVIDGTLREPGEKVQLTAEQGQVLSVQGYVAKRAGPQQQETYRAMMANPGTRGTSN